MAAKPLIVAIDNGGTNTRIRAQQGPEVIGGLSFETPPNYHEAIEEIAAKTSVLTEGRKPGAVGYAIAGQVGEGQITSAGQLQEYGWLNRPLAADMAGAFALQESQVVLINDCAAAAKSQQVANSKRGAGGNGYVISLSTGFGGAGFTDTDLIPDEPGHVFLKDGAVCGCGQEGHIEAHVSGSGIERKFGVTADQLSDRKWRKVVADLRDAHLLLLARLAQVGFEPRNLYYFGSIATRSPFALPGLAARLMHPKQKPPYLEGIKFATHKNDAGIVGAAEAAIDRLRQGA